MRFNIGFTPGTCCEARVCRRTQTINHAPAPFIENKRYRAKPRRVGGMVNRKAVSVYQTDQVLILVGGVQGRPESGRSPRTRFKNSFNKTKQYRVRRCSKQ
jgi:hypothetical protein